jgi:hypothetical protein
VHPLYDAGQDLLDREVVAGGGQTRRISEIDLTTSTYTCHAIDWAYTCKFFPPIP